MNVIKIKNKSKKNLDDFIHKEFIFRSSKESDTGFSDTEISIILLFIIFIVALLFWSPTTAIVK